MENYKCIISTCHTGKLKLYKKHKRQFVCSKLIETYILMHTPIVFVYDLGLCLYGSKYSFVEYIHTKPQNFGVDCFGHYYGKMTAFYLKESYTRVGTRKVLWCFCPSTNLWMEAIQNHRGLIFLTFNIYGIWK